MEKFKCEECGRSAGVIGKGSCVYCSHDKKNGDRDKMTEIKKSKKK